MVHNTDGAYRYAKFNCEGGFAFDRHVKQMVAKGEIVISRLELCKTRSITIGNITEKGIAEYHRLKKRLEP